RIPTISFRRICMKLPRLFFAVVFTIVCTVTIIIAIADPLVQRASSKGERPDEGLVLLWVSAVDSNGNSVPGLHQNIFHVWEDDTEQRIEYFSPNNEPISVGIISCPGIECADAPLTFLKTTSWNEEYFSVLENGTT